MKRDIKTVKENFIKVCKEYDINEVYVNFDKPFSEVHNKECDEIYVVLRNSNDSSCRFHLKSVFDTNYEGKNPGDFKCDNLGVHLITGTFDEKEEATWKIVQRGFRLLYYRGAGICFE